MKALSFFANHPVFTRDQFITAIGAEGGQSRRGEYLLRHHTSSGRVVRLRRGLYASVPAGTEPETVVVDPYLLATALQPDAVVAYHAALQFRGRSYSVWRRFHYLTSHRVRSFSFRGAEFMPVLEPHGRAPNIHARGVVEERHAGGVVRVTTWERTLVDLLSSPDLGGGWEEIWRSLEMVEFFDVDAVTTFALARESPVIAARVGFFLDQHRETLMLDRAHLTRLLAAAPRQPAYFDTRRTPGKLEKDWNLIVPEQVLGRTWAEVS